MVHAFVTKTSASKRRMACQKHSLNGILYFVFCISLLLQPYLHFTPYQSTSNFHSRFTASSASDLSTSLYCLCCRVADHDDLGLLLASRMMCYSASCIYPSHRVSVTQCQHRHTWEREHFGPAYVWKKAASREHWRLIVDAATLKKRMPRRDTCVNKCPE